MMVVEVLKDRGLKTSMVTGATAVSFPLFWIIINIVVFVFIPVFFLFINFVAMEACILHLFN